MAEQYKGPKNANYTVKAADILSVEKSAI
jgi:hypothetical protein